MRVGGLVTAAVVIVAAAVGWQLCGEAGRGDIRVVTEDPVLEAYLKPFEAAIGADLAGYRGHMYRVLTYARHLVGDAAAAAALEEMCVALVLHDAGLWTDANLAYIEPSVARAQAYLEGRGLRDRLVFDMIEAHHKLTPFAGPDADLVNAFRVADLVDFSLGLVDGGLGRHNVAKVKAAIPNQGFHASLVRLLVTLPKPWAILSIFRW